MTNQTNGSVRLFYALWPDGATRAELMQLQIAMQGRLTRSSNLHLTLAFLGDQPASSVPALTSTLARLPSTPMSLTIDRIGYFTEPHITWAGMSTVPAALGALQKSLVRELAQEDIRTERAGDFIAHITLARDTTILEDFPFDPIVWKAKEIALVQSEPGAEGVVYRVLASRMLDDC